MSNDHHLVAKVNGVKFGDQPADGAVTALGASTLTTSKGQRILGIELNKRLYLEGMTLGDAVIGAKQALAAADSDSADILLGWQIIGDPALVVNHQATNKQHFKRQRDRWLFCI